MKRHNSGKHNQKFRGNNNKIDNLAVNVRDHQNGPDNLSTTNINATINNGRDTVLPLEFLQNFKRKYPTAFDAMTSIRSYKGSDDIPNWPEWCFIPMGATFAFSSMTDPINYVEVGQQLAVLSPWRIGKQVLIIDPDLAERKYELKWVAPTFVGAHEDSNDPVVIQFIDPDFHSAETSS